MSGKAEHEPPDYSGLDWDFDVVETKVQQSRSVSSRDSDQASNISTDYLVTLRVKRLGRLSIPRIQVADDLTYPISINAIEQAVPETDLMNQLVFFNSKVDTQHAYVQAQILYTVKLFYDDSISGLFPPPKIADAVVETVVAGRRYESIINSRRYHVLEKKYAIFPQKSGTLIVPKVIFVGVRGRGSVITSRQEVQAETKTHRVEIRTIPTSFVGSDWIAAKDFSLAETWTAEPPVFRIGESVTRKLIVRATGLVNSSLPPFVFPKNAKIKTYTDPLVSAMQTDSEGLISTNTTTISIVPIEPGEFSLPEIRIPWWNTREDKLEVAIVPHATYVVLPAHEETVEVPVRQQPTAGTAGWLYATILLALVSLVTTLQWWRTSVNLNILTEKLKEIEAVTEPNVETAAPQDEAIAYEGLLKACKNNDATKAHKKLYVWASTYFNGIESTYNLLNFVRSEEFSGILEDLEQHLYSSGEHADGWQGANLITIIDEVRKRRIESRTTNIFHKT